MQHPQPQVNQLCLCGLWKTKVENMPFGRHFPLAQCTIILTK